MKQYVFVYLLMVSTLLCGQSTEAKMEQAIDSMAIRSDSAKEIHSNVFMGKLNKFKSLMNDSLMDETVVLGLEEEKDPNIDLLIQDYIENKKFNGYRIQIFASTVRLEALKIRADFLKKYPNEKSYLVYQAPNFKVRVGNYQDRLITHEHLAPIKIDFPSAFIVKDEIEPFIR